jgi:tetratricopeptide (TPR) repeat protein
MSPDEVAEMEPFLAPFADTVVSLVVDHSDQVFRFAGMVSGMPDLGPIISRAIEREHEHQQMNTRLSKAMRGRDWNRALEIIDAQIVEDPGSTELLQKKFQVLATGKQDAEAALTCAETLMERWNGDAKALNNLAWGLLTEEQYAGAYADLARRMSRQSNEITNYENWMFVDTLALAEFETGNLEAAVELERKCLDLCGDSAGRKGVETALAKFEAALGGDKLVSDAGGVGRP